MQKHLHTSAELVQLRSQLVEQLNDDRTLGQSKTGRFKARSRQRESAPDKTTASETQPLSKLSEILEIRVDRLSQLNQIEKRVLKAVVRIFATHERCSGAVRQIVAYSNSSGKNGESPIARSEVLNALNTLVGKGLVELIPDEAYPYRISKGAVISLNAHVQRSAQRVSLREVRSPSESLREVDITRLLSPEHLMAGVEPYGPIFEPRESYRNPLRQTGYCETLALLDGLEVIGGCGLEDGRSCLIGRVNRAESSIVSVIIEQKGTVLAEPLFGALSCDQMIFCGAGSDGRSWVFREGALVSVLRCGTDGAVGLESFDLSSVVQAGLESVFVLSDSTLVVSETPKRVQGALVSSVKFIAERGGKLAVIDQISAADLLRKVDMYGTESEPIIYRLEGVSGEVNSAKLLFSVAGEKLAPRTVVLSKSICNLERHKPIAGSDQPLHVFSPNGKALLSVQESKFGVPQCYLNRFGKDQQYISLFGYGEIKSAAFSPDDRYLAITASINGSDGKGCGVFIFDLAYTDVVRVAEFTHDSESLPGICFWSEADRLLFEDQVVQAWDLRRPAAVSINQVSLGQRIEGSDRARATTDRLYKELKEDPFETYGFGLRGVVPAVSSAYRRYDLDAQVTAIAVDPFYDGVFCGLASGAVVYQSFEPGRTDVVRSMFFEGRIGCLRLSKDGRRILAISAKGDVAVARLDKNRDVAGGAEIWPSFNPMLGEFSPDGRFVALVGMAPALRADRNEDEDTLEDYLASFDTPYDLCVEVYDLLELKACPVLKEREIFKTTQRPLGLAFTADRRELIYSTIGADVVTLSVFEKFGNGYRFNIRAKSSESALVAASQIACGPDGRVVLDRSVMLQLRDASGQRLHRSLELPIPDGSIISHAWSPHGDILALSWLSEGKPFVRLVSMTELDPFQRPKVIAEIVTGVDIPVLAFSSAGNQLIACGADRSVSLYMGDE